MEAMTWRKATRSSANGGNCVEVARTPSGSIAARDSKAPNEGMLRFEAGVFAIFIASAKRGDYDR